MVTGAKLPLLLDFSRRRLVTSEYGIAVPAAQPLTPDDICVHVAGFYDLDVEEKHGRWDLVFEVRRHVMSALHVVSVAIGFEDCERR